MLKELWRRHVPQILGFYLGACWVIVEFVTFLVERYTLSDNIIDLTLIGLLALLPTVLLIAWYHGARGRDELVLVEKIAIPLNVLVAAVLVVFLARGQELGAAVQEVAMMDASGQWQMQHVPRREFIKDGLVLFFEDPPQDEPWLAYAAAELLARSGSQHPFLRLDTLYRDHAQGLIWQAKRAGYDEGTGLSLALAQSLAEQRQQQYLVRGRFTGSEGMISLAVYRTSDLELLGSEQFDAPNLFAATDRAREYLVQALDVQSAGALAVPILPSAELFSQSRMALRAYTLAKNALLLDNDPDQAATAFQQALEHDPSLTFAHLQLAELYANQVRETEALEAVRNALAHQYKLSRADRFRAQALQHKLSGDQAQWRAVFQHWRALAPDDPEPINLMANRAELEGQRDEAIELHLQSLETDKSQNWILARLGSLYLAGGNRDAARAAWLDYLERRPDGVVTLIAMAYMEMGEGDFAAAEQWARRAAVARPDFVDPLLTAAHIALHQGHIEDARTALNRASAVANAPRQHAAVQRAQIVLFETLGQPARAIEALEASLLLQDQYDNAIEVAAMLVRHAYLYADAGRIEDGLAHLARRGETLDDAVDNLLALGYSTLYLRDGLIDQAQPYLGRFAVFLDDLGAQHLRYLAHMETGLAAMAQERWADAVGALETARAAYRESMAGLKPDSMVYELDLLLARALLHAREIDQAAAALDKTLREWPAHPEANRIMAEIALADGDMETGRQHLTRTLRAWEAAAPDYLPLQQARQTALELGLAQVQATVNP